MYYSYFGLNENPFSIAPDPLYLYMSERHREALAHLQYGIGSNGGFVLLTGEIGAGKTTLCRRLLEQLPEGVDVAYVLNPMVNARELLETVCDELCIDRPDQASIKQLVDRLNHRLLEANAKGRKTVLIIDEAQHLSVEVLEQLRLLTNLETDRHKLLQIVLLGQPELRRILAREDMRQLSQRITARCHLGALDADEISLYIQHRLQVAGCSRPLFAPALHKSIWKMTGGIPRLVNLVCDRALLGAYARNSGMVDRAILVQAGREVLGEEPSASSRSPFLKRFLPATMLVAVVVAVLVFWQPRNLPVNASAPDGPVPPPQAVAPVAAPAPEINEAPAAPVPLPVHWPTGFATDRGREEAYADLARLWKIDYAPGRRDFCSFAAENGLQCLARRDSLETLRGFDLPVMLALYDDNGAPFHVIMQHLDGNRALFTAGNDSRDLDVAAIEARWFGEYLLLWEPQVVQGQVLEPGGKGALADWLASSLAEIGLYRPEGQEERLEGALLSALKRFQGRAGLTPDGILGPMTLIHLNKAIESPGPRLLAKESG